MKMKGVAMVSVLEEWGLQIVLSNLPYGLTTAELKDLAGSSRRAAASLVHADVLRLSDGRSKGQGIMVFSDPRAAEAAVQVRKGRLSLRPHVTPVALLPCV